MTIEQTINILLIEDNPDDELIIREMLSQTVLTHCHVQGADLFSRGKQWLAANPGGADLILLDLFLPDSQGMDTLLDLKKHIPDISDIPIVVLTGFDNEEMGRRAIKEGAQDYICKSDLTLSILENSIRFAIERHQLIMQLEKKKNQVLESELRFRNIIEKNADGILILGHKGQILLINPAAQAIFANTSKEIVADLFCHVLASKEMVELGVTREERDVVFVEARLKEVKWQGETVYLVSLRDITDRKKFEKFILVEKEKLDITLHSLGDGVITADKNGIVSFVNPAALQMIGWTKKQALGQHINQVLKLELEFAPYLDESQPCSHGTSLIALYGDQMMIDYSYAQILDKENQVLGFVFCIRDITLQQKMAEEMLKVRKLESLGIVARKLAHEYENVFTVIMENISQAKTSLDCDDRVFKILEKSEKSAQRANELTNQLHTFLRTRASYQNNVSIAKLLQDVVIDILVEVESSKRCQWNIADDLWTVEFDNEQMYTALRNIIINAKESMPNGLGLEISIENTMISNKMHFQLKSGRYVKISIKDRGVGMEREMIQKIFDPFFTTKEKTTGIGLTTAFSIIRDHRGTIDVESEKGVGSTFTIYLPSRDSAGKSLE